MHATHPCSQRMHVHQADALALSACMYTKQTPLLSAHACTPSRHPCSQHMHVHQADTLALSACMYTKQTPLLSAHACTPSRHPCSQRMHVHRADAQAEPLVGRGTLQCCCCCSSFFAQGRSTSPFGRGLWHPRQDRSIQPCSGTIGATTPTTSLQSLQRAPAPTLQI